MCRNTFEWHRELKYSESWSELIDDLRIDVICGMSQIAAAEAAILPYATGDAHAFY